MLILSNLFDVKVVLGKVFQIKRLQRVKLLLNCFVELVLVLIMSFQFEFNFLQFLVYFASVFVRGLFGVVEVLVQAGDSRC